MASSMLVLTPISENAARNRKHSINPPPSRNIPLFNSPKIRRSLGQGLGMTPAILDQSLTGEQVWKFVYVIYQNINSDTKFTSFFTIE